jgi:hypothetical protein
VLLGVHITKVALFVWKETFEIIIELNKLMMRNKNRKKLKGTTEKEDYTMLFKRNEK